MARELNLYVDSERGALVSGFTSTIPATLAPFKFGDSVPVICRVLTPDTSSSIRPYKEFDLTDRELRVGIGVPAGLPTVGTFTLTYGANTTAAISFDADAAAVQTALNALASITSAGGVTVTKPNDGAYRIVFNTAGDRTAISGDTSSLYPTTGAFIGVAQQGTGSLKEIVVISLETQPAAYVLLEDDLPVAAIGVTVVRAGGSGVGEIQTIDLSSPEPYDGTFSLEIDGNSTPAIAYNALADEVQSAIESASEDYVGEVTVTGTFPRYTISFGSTLGALGAMTADASDLVVPKGRKGSLNLNTTGVIELLNGEASATAKLEIEILDLDNSTPWTVIQQDVTVNQDVIPNSPASQTPLPTYITSDTVGGAIDSTLSGADSKTTPVNADTIPLSDSAASWVTKQVSWANIKAALKSYFDPIYVALTGNQTKSGVLTFTSSPVSTGTPSGNTGIMNRIQTDHRPFMFLRPTDSFQIRRRQDYFFRGSTASGDIGEWGWSSTVGSGGSVAYGEALAFPTGRTLEMQTGTTDNGSVYISKTSGSLVEKAAAASFYIVTDVPSNGLSAINSAAVWGGWSNSVAGWVLVGWDTDVGPNFLIRMKGDVDGAETVIDTGVAVPTNATFWQPQMVFDIIGDYFNGSVLGGAGFRIVISSNTSLNTLNKLYDAQHTMTNGVFGSGPIVSVTTRTAAAKKVWTPGVEIFHGSGFSANQH